MVNMLTYFLPLSATKSRQAVTLSVMTPVIITCASKEDVNQGIINLATTANVNLGSLEPTATKVSLSMFFSFYGIIRI